LERDREKQERRGEICQIADTLFKIKKRFGRYSNYLVYSSYKI
jgi:hypothetical protein